MSSWFQEIRSSARALGRQPGFTTAAVLSLALGMGVNTAIFSAVDALLLRPLPFRDLDRTVYVFHADKDHPDSGTSFTAYQQYRSRTDVFSGAMAFSAARPLIVTDGDQRQQVYAELVTADFFTIADIRLRFGRPFDVAVERTVDPPHVAVVSDRFWSRHLGSDPAAVGKTIVLNDRAFTIAGVAMPGFTGLDREAVADLWIPLTVWAHLIGEPGRLTGDEHWVTTVGRLKDAVSIEQARTAMAIAGQALRAPAGLDTRVRAASEPVAGSSTDALAIGGAAIGVGLLVLALACMNVTSLLLARVAARQWEMSVRLSLGASRWRLIRAWLVDSVLLAAVAGAAGLVVAAWLIDLVVVFKPPVLIGHSEAPTLPLTFDLNLRIFGFALGLCALTAAGVGLVSGLQASPARGKADRRFAPGVNVRSAVIASQMALSLLLLIPCGLFLRSWLNASAIDPGFSSERVLLLPISSDQAGVRVQKPPGFEADVIARVAAVPGVEAVTAMDPVPLWFGGNNAHFSVGASEQAVRVGFSRIAPGYFDTLRMRLLRGRDFTTSDTAAAPRVAIVSETMARRHWPDGNAVGGTLRHGRDVIDVIGVAADAKYRSLGEASEPWLYLSLAQEPTENPALSLAVRTAGDPGAFREPIVRAVRSLVPSWPAFQFRTLDEGLALQRRLPRFTASLLGALGAIGLLLASIGLYGVMTYVVKQRTHEMGIRLALGSSAARVMALVIKQGMTLCLAGAAVGFAAALAASRLMASLLSGISAVDPLTFALVPALLIGVGVLACYVPARHAARVNPVEALRRE